MPFEKPAMSRMLFGVSLAPRAAPPSRGAPSPLVRRVAAAASPGRAAPRRTARDGVKAASPNPLGRAGARPGRLPRRATARAEARMPSLGPGRPRAMARVLSPVPGPPRVKERPRTASDRRPVLTTPARPPLAAPGVELETLVKLGLVGSFVIPTLIRPRMPAMVLRSECGDDSTPSSGGMTLRLREPLTPPQPVMLGRALRPSERVSGQDLAVPRHATTRPPGLVPRRSRVAKSTRPA